MVVCLQRLQNVYNGKERSVIAAFIGFLKKELTKFSGLYEDVLAQVSSVQSSYSVAVIISCLPEETIRQITSSMFDDTESDDS